MTRIRFLSTQIYDTGAPGKGPTFEKGSVLDAADVGDRLNQVVTSDFAEGFLRRWVSRGVAVVVDPNAPDEAATDENLGLTVDLNGMTRAELDKLAADRGIDIAAAKNKAEVIAIINAAAD